jgi:hypothetical protein
VLLIDRNLILLSKKSQSSKTTSEEQETSKKSQSSKITPEEQELITPKEKELLDSALDVIRARTLSILRRFENDAERKTSVIRFLIEAEIISKSRLNLKRADLSWADLSWANLEKANLEKAHFDGANLFRANLTGAILIFAHFDGANLEKAELKGAILEGADLKDIQWDSETKWPDKSAFANAKNIPEELKKELGITP